MKIQRHNIVGLSLILALCSVAIGVIYGLAGRGRQDGTATGGISPVPVYAARQWSAHGYSSDELSRWRRIHPGGYQTASNGTIGPQVTPGEQIVVH